VKWDHSRDPVDVPGVSFVTVEQLQQEGSPISDSIGGVAALFGKTSRELIIWAQSPTIKPALERLISLIKGNDPEGRLAAHSAKMLNEDDSNKKK
jgi:hypothetical protein